MFLNVSSWSQSQSYVTTDGQSASLSWCQAPIWGTIPDFCYCQTVAGLLMWGALSDQRMGLSFTIAGGPRQCSHIYSLQTLTAVLLHEFYTVFVMVISPIYISPARTAQITSFPLLRDLSFAWGETCPQGCSLATAVVPSPVYTTVTWQWVYMSQYNNPSSSVRLSHTVSLKRCVIEKLLETKYVSFGKPTQGKSAFLLYAWVRVQANLFRHYFLRKKGLEIITIRDRNMNEIAKMACTFRTFYSKHGD
jgi:hypothetical protein